jgi:hypothetical protein
LIERGATFVSHLAQSFALKNLNTYQSVYSIAYGKYEEINERKESENDDRTDI